MTYGPKGRSKIKIMRRDLEAIRIELANLWGTVNSSSLSLLETSVGEVLENILNNQLQFAESLARCENEQRLGREVATQLLNLQRECSIHKPVQSPTSLDAHEAVVDRLEAFSAIYVRTAQERACFHDGCRCTCHMRRRLRFPGFLKDIVGTFFLEYSGVPTRSRLCIGRCERHSSLSAYATYYFPRWLLMKVISARIANLFGQFQASLKVSRVVPSNSKVFQFAREGDIKALHALFTQRLASPFDISDATGGSVLTSAINGRQPEVCKLLLDEGADVYALEKYPLKRPIDFAWEVMLAHQEFHRPFQRIFSDDEYLSEMQLSVLHRIILGLIPRKLEDALALSTIDINLGDSEGRTPLSYAAARCDAQAVKLLLYFGADPNGRLQNDKGTMSPLHHSAKSGSVECTRILLEYHADVKYADSWGNTALIFAAIYGKSRELCQLLLEKGADISAQDRMGYTPLRAAIMWDSVTVLKFLLDNGAGLDATDEGGYTPLLHAVWQNRHGCLKALLRRGANTRVVTTTGQTVLHLAATFGDVETVKILTNATSSGKLQGVDHAALDADGHTAEDLFKERKIMMPGLCETIKALWNPEMRDVDIKSVNEMALGVVYTYEDDSGARSVDIFVDAVEYQDIAGM